MTEDVDAQTIRDVKLFTYREALGLTYEQALNEPNEEIERAFVIWSLKRERDKLEAAKRTNN